MIFLYLMPILYGVYGNYLQAHSMGLSDMMLPRFNLFALQVLALSLYLMSLAIYLSSDLYYGWTLYPPIALVQYLEVMVFGLHLSGVSSILTSLNLLLSTNAEQRHHLELNR